MNFLERNLRGVCFHHYNYAYPGEQPEGIRQRIRQGIGGPKNLEVDAEVHGHLHVPKGTKLAYADEYPMSFGKERWLVKLTEISDLQSHMIVPEDSNEGYEIQGVCVRRIEESAST